MRSLRLLLHLATVVVAMAVATHLFMHLRPHDLAGGDGHHGPVERPGAVSSSVVAADAPAPDDVDNGHPMAALCMAVLAVAALAALTRLVGRSTATATAALAAVGRWLALRLRAPPTFLPRIDAGVLLRV